MSQDMQTPALTTVWTEIPVTDLEAGAAFYRRVFGWEMPITHMGPERVAAFGSGGVGGNLVEGPVAGGKGPVIHLRVPETVEAATERALAAGATAEGPLLSIPPGRYQMIHDPDGNRIGLFEPAMQGA